MKPIRRVVLSSLFHRSVTLGRSFPSLPARRKTKIRPYEGTPSLSSFFLSGCLGCCTRSFLPLFLLRHYTHSFPYVMSSFFLSFPPSSRKLSVGTGGRGETLVVSSYPRGLSSLFQVGSFPSPFLFSLLFLDSHLRWHDQQKLLPLDAVPIAFFFSLELRPANKAPSSSPSLLSHSRHFHRSDVESPRNRLLLPPTQSLRKFLLFLFLSPFFSPSSAAMQIGK